MNQSSLDNKTKIIVAVIGALALVFAATLSLLIPVVENWSEWHFSMSPTANFDAPTSTEQPTQTVVPVVSSTSTPTLHQDEIVTETATATTTATATSAVCSETEIIIALLNEGVYARATSYIHSGIRHGQRGCG